MFDLRAMDAKPVNQKKWLGLSLGLFVGFAFAFAGVTWMNNGTAPSEPGESFYVRWESRSFESAVNELVQKGVVKDANAFLFRAKIERQQQPIADGTYEFEPGMDFDKVILNMRKPLSTMVRIPEGWWIARVAKRLEEKQVCKADEYIKLANNPDEFKDAVSFTLPEESLEGYLYPDTYDLPPLLGARATIKRQLQAFQSKVVDELGEEELERAVNVGSMIELEAALDEERPIIAGVIENRIKQGMRLQLDATVLYALQEWKQLGPGVVNTVDSPYNTYRIAGLPPGPIGSPSFRSIEAALNPAAHDKLYYVARPNRSHYFSRTYDEHRANINKARKEFAETNQ